MTKGAVPEVGIGKTVLITGASRGLGRALAVEMARRGHSIVGCARSYDSLHSLRADLHPSSSSSSSSSPSPHLINTTDVRSDSSVQELAKLVKESRRVPDIIVNNAGAINKNNKIWSVPAEEFDMVVDTNIKGTTNILRHFLPLMIEKKQGIIVNMSSGWGRSAAAEVVKQRGLALLFFASASLKLLLKSKALIWSFCFFCCIGEFHYTASSYSNSTACCTRPNRFHYRCNKLCFSLLFQVAPYCATKWAIEGLTRSVAKELPPGLAIIALSPGVVNTDMLASCFGSTAALYQTPEAWAPKAATMILNLTVEDNGASLTV